MLPRAHQIRLAAVVGLLLGVGLAHWMTPLDHPFLQGLHVVMRKMFMIPVVLGAAWWGIRGVSAVAVGVTLIYLPHVALQWSGRSVENLNQMSELASIWTVAVLVGCLVHLQEQSARALTETQRATVASLVRALDARERATERHSLRVAAVSCDIGMRIGLKGPDLTALRTGALLHDVGKIGVPDAILLKPAPLSDEEWRIMRCHPEIGRHILLSVPRLGKAIDVVYAHHERFDGTGYPRGLSGNAIPLIARVFAVADALDAMISHRPYKDPIPLDQARKRIAADAHTHFDPRVVKVFLSIPPERMRHLLDENGRSPLDAVVRIARDERNSPTPHIGRR